MITWIFSIIGIIGSVLNIFKYKSCFILWEISNIGFIFYFIYVGFWSQVVLFAVNFLGAIWGYIQWRKDERVANKS